MSEILTELARERVEGFARGITSVCSAHPWVIRAALRRGRHSGQPVLIEATCNQVNQDGGYTGMTPADFRRFVLEIAAEEGFDPADLILGGDHLGPSPWRKLPAEAALTVVVEDGDSDRNEISGGSIAAPIAKSIMQAVVQGK